MSDGRYENGFMTAEYWLDTISYTGLFINLPAKVRDVIIGPQQLIDYHYNDNRIGRFWYKDGVMTGEQCIPSDTIAGLLANHPVISEYYTTGSQ